MATQIAPRHPRDGVKRYDYVSSKIDHMRRIGVVTITKTFAGCGRFGGACPNWLNELREDEDKRSAAYRLRRLIAR